METAADHIHGSARNGASYLACDLSGIQKYVLGVKTAGNTQAKRLRARSFLLELYERAALLAVQESLGVTSDDVLIQGGGGFLVRLGKPTESQALSDLAAELQGRIWRELRGEVSLSWGWGATPQDARLHLEREKRRPGRSVFQADQSWRHDRLSLPAMGDPCDVCGRAPGSRTVRDDDSAEVVHCANCLAARDLGERLTRWTRMRPTVCGPVQALEVRFAEARGDHGDSFPVGRWIPRSGNGDPLTFREIAGKAKGQSSLAVLKADVDDTGIHLARAAAADQTYGQLQKFSRDLHQFFLERVQQMLARSWDSIYTIYAGGDDLLLVGPWNQAFDFAGALAREFETGPGAEYGLTFSAGLALTPYRVPIRHAVELAEELLESAKQVQGKNRCAGLGAIWTWDDHDLVIGSGRDLAHWVESRLLSRSLLHRLLRLLESDDPTRWARWVYQIKRNVSPRNGGAAVHGWSDRTIDMLDADESLSSTVAASIRYAFLATRAGEG